MSCSLLLQQCPACLIRQTWIVFVMGGRWPYSCSFVECCLQDLFNIPHRISVISLHSVIWLNSSIWPINGTLKDTIILGRSEFGSNGNEGALHISQNSKNGASPSNAIYCHTQIVSIICHIDWTLKGTTTSGSSGYGTNGNYRVSQRSWTGTSLSHVVKCHTKDTSSICPKDVTLKVTTSPG